MKLKLTLLISILLLKFSINSQNSYFPPLIGSTWDSIAPNSLGYCQPRIDSLYNFLSAKNTKSFMILKDGRRILEKYFGTFTKDSIWYWASASKSLASFITGIAQQKGFININNKVSQYIGNNWTSELIAKENLITVKNLLKMTSGLDDAPPACSNEDTMKTCLIYKVDAGSRWAYHTGAYKKVQDIVSNAVGLSYNTITNNWIKSYTGMSGCWVQQIYYSKTRDAARFGLLALNKGIWNNDTLLKDSTYFNAMVHPSQNMNNSYGYLWWLNGQSSYMSPGTQIIFPGELVPNAPSDMYCALGKNDQKIYVVPSQKIVIVRFGNKADNESLALSDFDNALWDYINKLNCTGAFIKNTTKNEHLFKLYPNPIIDNLVLEFYSEGSHTISVYDVLGQLVLHTQNQSIKNTINMSDFKPGIYTIEYKDGFNNCVYKKLIKQ